MNELTTIGINCYYSPSCVDVCDDRRVANERWCGPKHVKNAKVLGVVRAEIWLSIGLGYSAGLRRVRCGLLERTDSNPAPPHVAFFIIRNNTLSPKIILLMGLFYIEVERRHTMTANSPVRYSVTNSLASFNHNMNSRMSAILKRIYGINSKMNELLCSCINKSFDYSILFFFNFIFIYLSIYGITLYVLHILLIHL